ncbi:hypothetical protein NE865_03526 [Phthorimaea operculella]|nr:hypothetical protein NE865_03526 [Phthorimaea operculella]
MFNRKGSLNNRGMHTIFKNVSTLMNDITEWNVSQLSKSEEAKMFFREGHMDDASKHCGTNRQKLVPNYKNIRSFLEKLRQLLEIISKQKYKHLLIAGDFNINRLIRSKLAHKFECLLLNYNLKLEFNQPTRLRPHSAAVGNPVKRIYKATFWRTKRREYSKENLVKFSAYINSLSFSEIYKTDNPNVAYSEFISIFKLLYELCFPFKMLTNKINKSTKWISKGIKACSRRKRDLLYKYRSQGKGPQNMVFLRVVFWGLPKFTEHHMTLFADDSTLTIACNNNNSIIYKNDINNSLTSIIAWLDNNNLKINLDKTKIMHFEQRSKLISKFEISNENKIIEKVDSTKFLGLIMDKKLDWKLHISELCKKLNQSAYALHKLASVTNIETLLTAYYGMVDTHLRYGVIFWANSTDRELAFKAQKRCIRSMLHIKQDDSCRPYFIKHKILTLPCLYILEMALFVKRNPDLFTKVSDVVVRNRRDNDLVCIPRFKTALMKKGVICMAPRIYNKIPKHIRTRFSIHCGLPSSFSSVAGYGSGRDTYAEELMTGGERKSRNGDRERKDETWVDSRQDGQTTLSQSLGRGVRY